MKFYSAIKNKMSFSGKWMDLENIILSEINQSVSEVSYVFSHMWKLGSNQDTIETLDNGGETSVG